jgi:methyltransferase (TIGR00027 family)
MRTDDDTWDVTESVGATALTVAAARAVETEGARPLFHDPFARVFLDAAGDGMWCLFDRSSADVDPELAVRVQTLRDFVAARTVFIDDFFASAVEDGIRQVVILASGLDARAWRLQWPEGTRIYELDQPKVLDFKASTLRDHGAEPTARRIEVPVDLRHDWPTALQRNGFDASEPTAWSAEGLLRYLPSKAQDLLFEHIHALSAPGSRIVLNAPTDDALDPGLLQRERELTQRLQTALGTRLDVAAPNELAYAEKRTDVAGWLAGRGWEASTTTVLDAAARYGRSPAESGSVPSILISGRLTPVAPPHTEEEP